MSLIRHRRKYQFYYLGLFLSVALYTAISFRRRTASNATKSSKSIHYIPQESPDADKAGDFTEDDPQPMHLYAGPDDTRFTQDLDYYDGGGTCAKDVLNRVHAVYKGWKSVTPAKLTGNDRAVVRRMMKGKVYKTGGKDFCRHFLEFGRLRHKVLPYIWGSSDTKADSVTFVTQLSDARFGSLLSVLENWKGAISAAVYLRAADVLNFIKELCDCPALNDRTNVDIHLVLKTGDLYPINYLRNVALNYTTTPLAFLSDVDFIPSFNTLDEVAKIYHNKQSFFDNNVLIVPAFEVEEGARSDKYPSSKANMMTMWETEKLKPARIDRWKPGHMPTDYPKWKYSEIIYEVTYKSEFEPYIVIRTDRAPRYNEAFVERYRDKCQHIHEVAAMGFHFYVMPDTFTLHYPHSRSSQSSSSHLFRCAMDVHHAFVKYIRKKYNYRR